MRSIFLVLLAFALAQVSSQPERAIVAAIDAGNADALALLEKAVNINSGTHNFAGVRAVGDLFRREFDALGFKTAWIDGAAFKRAGHLVADHPGNGPRTILIGHLDTVFEPDSPFQKFQRIDDKTATGPGIIDMKGGDVIIIAALKALKATGALAGMNLVVVMTGDEEDAGDPQDAARAALVDAAKGAEYALGFEDGPGDPKFAVTARRGTSSWKLDVTAKTGHSSQIFRDDIGYGANYELARILDGFRRKLAGEAHLTFNPSLVLGGTAAEADDVLSKGTASGKTNVIAAHAIALGDLRTLSKEQLQHARDTMKAVVAETPLAQTKATLTFGDGYPSLPPTEGNARLLAEYDRASRDLGFGVVAAVSPDRAGAADVSFISGQVKSIMDGIGLMGHDDHSPMETADLTTLPSQTKRAAILLYRLNRAKQ
ncbi:MAG TPA: M20/M25/M40 family metallo-hydrolase [Vicinamibacterales bacterium]|nr:M20/M25/M40 family metallo-hydrolase [Vicinamibacterales bacterium]